MIFTCYENTTDRTYEDGKGMQHLITLALHELSHSDAYEIHTCDLVNVLYRIYGATFIWTALQH